MRHSKKMAAPAFDRLIERVNVGAKGVEIARQVLVEGRPQKAIAEQYQLSPSAVNRYVSTVWQAYVNSGDLPDDLQRITVVLPKDKVAIVMEWEKQEMIRRLTLDM